MSLKDPLNSGRVPLSASVVSGVLDRIAPGAQVLSVRRLGGGIDAHMHKVRYQAADGTLAAVVVRRYPAAMVEWFPNIVSRCWDALTLAAPLGVGAPHPLLRDDSGVLLGMTGLVMAAVPGKGHLRFRDGAAIATQLARALAKIHALRLSNAQAGNLVAAGRVLERLEEDDPPAHADMFGEQQRARQVLGQWRQRIDYPELVFCHGDYWAGNTLWLRGRMTAVVDWDFAMHGWAVTDVCYCRMDLAMNFDIATADLFLAAYEEMTGKPVPDRWFWDLVPLLRLPVHLSVWLAGAQALGRSDLTVPAMQQALRIFTEQALMRVPSSGR